MSHFNFINGFGGNGIDFDLLIREQLMLNKFGRIPMNHLPSESVEQFDRLTERGIKLNLISGEYHE